MDQKKEKNGGQEAVVPEKDYKEAYEQEHYKSTYLAGRVAELEDQVDDLQFKLDRIKNNPVWSSLKAVQNNKVIYADYSTYMLGFGIVSQEAIMKQISDEWGLN